MFFLHSFAFSLLFSILKIPMGLKLKTQKTLLTCSHFWAEKKEALFQWNLQKPFPKELAVWNNSSQSVYTEQEVEGVAIGRQSDANELEKVKDAGRERLKRRKTNLP